MSVFHREHLRIPDDFPQVAIDVTKISSVTTVERVLCRLDDFCARALRRIIGSWTAFRLDALCPIVKAVDEMGYLGRVLREAMRSVLHPVGREAPTVDDDLVGLTRLFPASDVACRRDRNRLTGEQVPIADLVVFFRA